LGEFEINNETAARPAEMNASVTVMGISASLLCERFASLSAKYEKCCLKVIKNMSA
jgi:hypothetical protein